MKNIKKIFIFFIILFIYLFFFINEAKAITYDLIAPSEVLHIGQEVKFIINVDTEGKSYSSAQIGMTYDTKVLEFVSTTAGDTFKTISAENVGDGKLIITGSSDNPYSGSGVYAYVTFKIIAQQAGSTQLCTLFNPDNTPTPAPTDIPITRLPTSGINSGTTQTIIGGIFVFLAILSFFIFKNI